jgi:hypothetical protein
MPMSMSTAWLLPVLLHVCGTVVNWLGLLDVFYAEQMATIKSHIPPPKRISTDQQFAIFPVQTRDLGKSRPDIGQGVICPVDVVFLIAGAQDEPWRHRCCYAAVYAVRALS